MRGRRGRAAGIVAGALAAAGAALAGTWTALVAARWALAVGRTARLALRVATLTAYRRCPACWSVRRREARVCARCGGVLGS